MPSGAVYLLGGVVMVSSHSDQLQGCVDCAVVVWLAVTKQGRQWCHGGMAGGSWLLLVLLVVELGCRQCP